MAAVTCPKCQFEAHLPANWSAPGYTCPHCHSSVVVPPDPLADLDEPRPRRRRQRRDDDYDDRPRRRRDESTHTGSAFGTMFGGVLGCFAGIAVVVIGVIFLFVWSCGRAVEKIGEEAARKEEETKTAPRAVAGKQSAKLDAVSVGITSATVGKARWMEFDREAVSEDDLLILRIEIGTKDPTKKIQYRTWRKPPLFADATARAWDNFGNSHVRLHEGLFGHFRDAVETATITADTPASDLLLFDKPLKTAEHLDLDLPGDAVGLKATDVFRFRIPKEMWAKR